VIRLKEDLSDDQVELLNMNFNDILVTGKITKSQALPQEGQDETSDLPRLVLNFNQRDLGRLYQMIGVINQVGIPTSEAAVHPERK
jgi:hypothetical protein